MLKRGPSRGASSGPAIRTAPDVHWYRMLPLILGKPYLDAPLVAGGDRLYAVTRVWRVRNSLGDLDPRDAQLLADRRRHRLSGRIAVIASVFAYLTASLILAGMYWRA